MADNNKVTIDADYFAELYAAKKDKEQYAEAVLNIANERVELQAALEKANQTNSAQAEQLRDALNALEQERMNKCDEVTAKRLAAAERCIEDIFNILDGVEGGALSTDDIHEIIRAYREKKEAQ